MTEISAEDAFLEGVASDPVQPEGEVAAVYAGDIRAGDEVAIERQGEQAGDVVVHFPNIGFEVQPV